MTNLNSMSPCERPLASRTAVITGASQGLGRAIAGAMLEAGANLFLIARDENVLAEATHELRERQVSAAQKIECWSGDVADPATSIEAFERAESQVGPISILVNNAGVYGPIGRAEEVDWSEWVETMRINCFGVVLFCRAVLPIFRRRGYGKIINVSGGGATKPLPRFSAYAASKAAVVRFTETLAQECQNDGIDVNALAPGALNTRFLDQLLDAGPEKVGSSLYAQSVQQRETGGASPMQAADLAVFLASAASDGITGRLISAVWDDWKNLPAVREKLANSDLYTLRRIVPEDRRNTWSAA